MPLHVVHAQDEAAGLAEARLRQDIAPGVERQERCCHKLVLQGAEAPLYQRDVCSVHERGGRRGIYPEIAQEPASLLSPGELHEDAV